MAINLPPSLRARLVAVSFSNLALAKCQEISMVTVWAKSRNMVPRIVVLCKNDVSFLKTKVDHVHSSVSFCKPSRLHVCSILVLFDVGVPA